jgi:hypothetical protein
MIRPFDWRDIPVLHRYRNQSLFFNNALEVTRGTAISPTVLLSYLTPTTGFFTWVYIDTEQTILAQLNHPAETPIGYVTFLTPERAIRNSGAVALLEHLAKHAGQRGAFNLLAEVDELAPVYEILRQAGFGIYARQRIWKFPEESRAKNHPYQWRNVKEKHNIPIQTLYHNVVPGLVGQIESMPTKYLQGLVCFKDGDLIGYADLKYGYHGIWARPFIHPDVENIDELLSSMIENIPDRRSRPIYLCVRTYQSWLEPALGKMESRSSPLQAVMVKRLAVQQKLALQALPKIDGQTEISAPMAHSQRNR